MSLWFLSSVDIVSGRRCYLPRFFFSGGEVLVRDDLERAGAEVTRRGYAWGMVTNGMALTEARLRSLLDAGLRSVSVSIFLYHSAINFLYRHKLINQRLNKLLFQYHQALYLLMQV